MTDLELLRRAKALVGRGWTRGAYARDASGQAVDASDPAAVCWCAMGACIATAPRGVSVSHLLKLVVRGDVGSWNDDRRTSKADVLAAFDQAIALAASRASRLTPPRLRPAR